jgi:hypothetical protein
MPAHILYLLQPLDIGCFSPLKKAYGNKVGCLIRNCIYYINKLSFLPAFKIAFKRAFIKDNIYLSFRGASLVLFNLEVVLLKLSIKLCTPIPPAVEDTLWESKTPSNPYKLEA